jgi:peptidoglycan LD-endopeptidase LytH
VPQGDDGDVVRPTSPSICAPRPLRAAAVAVAFAVAASLLLAPPVRAEQVSAEEVERDASVVEARARLAADRAHAEAVARNLDAAAGVFERAQAHQLRLAEEVDSQERGVATAGERLRAAEAAFAQSVAETYKHPAADPSSLAGAVAFAPDAGTAMHRAALVARLGSVERLRARRAAILLARSADDSRQHEVVRSGVAVAAEEAARHAAALEEVLDAAWVEAERAEQELDAAEVAARKRIEEERRRAAAELRAQQIAAMGSGPLPPVGGKVCPIGAPNGFIDSWGFPRSGGRQHQGVDIFAAYGMPLYAVADGTISKVWNNRLGGLSINLIDTAGDRYYYAHLSAVAVTQGQQVRAGEVIGANGNSGNARTTPPHLHWQYHPGNGPPVNPFPLAAALCR